MQIPSPSRATVPYRVVNLDWVESADAADRSLDVFWRWNDIPEQKLFATNEEVDFEKKCFGCSEAKELWRSKFGHIYYELCWTDKGKKISWINDKDKLPVLELCDTKALTYWEEFYGKAIQELNTKMREFENKRKAAEAAKKQINQFLEIQSGRNGGAAA